MALLARRNLFHDRIRFAVTLTGIVFALVLIIVQFGLFLGFTTTTSNNIDQTHADLWIVFHSVGYFDTGRMFSGRKKVRTDKPSERVDTKILEALMQLDPGQKLPLGCASDVFVQVGKTP